MLASRLPRRHFDNVPAAVRQVMAEAVEVLCLPYLATLHGFKVDRLRAYHFVHFHALVLFVLEDQSAANVGEALKLAFRPIEARRAGFDLRRQNYFLLACRDAERRRDFVRTTLARFRVDRMKVRACGRTGPLTAPIQIALRFVTRIVRMRR